MLKAKFDPGAAGTGIHLITYTYTDSSGCAGEDTSGIMVNALPYLSLGNDTAICAQNSLLLDAGAGLSIYIWSTGETTQRINADSSGHGIATVTYTVTVTDSLGCSADAEIKVTFDICTSLIGLSEQHPLQVFPNPFSDKIFILSDETRFEVKMFDLAGKVVYRRMILGANPVIQPAISAGVYFIQIETNNVRHTIKLVKTN